MKPFKTFLLLFMTSFLLANGAEEKRKKTINKSFSVNSNAALEVVNKYGNLNLTSWDKNTIQINVEITVEGNRAQERLNKINVEFNASKEKVIAVTRFGSKKSYKNSQVKVNYNIKLPKTNHVYLTNDYGGINIDELKGRSSIDLDYGSLKLGQMHNSSNNLALDYVNNAEINYINQANISMDYGGMNIQKANQINWESDYSTLKIKKIDQLNFEMDYGSLKVEEVKDAIGEVDYTAQTFGTINNKLIIEGDYTAVSIAHLKEGFQNLELVGDYSALKAFVDKNAGYQFNGQVSYGAIKLPDNFNYSSKISKNHSSTVSGKAGNGKGKVYFEGDYSSVKIKYHN